MKTGYVQPSCNFNIVLTEDDIKNLVDGKGLLFVPGHNLTTICNTINKETMYVPLNLELYSEVVPKGMSVGTQPIQFITISKEKGERDETLA